MAEKLVFFPSDKPGKYYEERLVSYTFYGGFAKSQKQKCIVSLHDEIVRAYPSAKPVDISRYSTNELGTHLSAFNLQYEFEGKDYPVECIYQGSKLFVMGGPYTDLYLAAPKDAKRDPRLRESGEIIGYQLGSQLFPSEPLTAFYDWIYLRALSRRPELTQQLMQFNCFTDIVFNHNKSLACQARTCAIYITLVHRDELSRLDDFKRFVEIYG